MWRNITIGALFLALIIVGALLFRQCDRADTAESNAEALADSLRTYRDKEGRHVAKIKTLQAKSRDYLNKISGKDQYIQDLKDRVEEYKDELESATVSSSETSVNVSTGTEVIGRTDTVWKNDTLELYPTYRSTLETDWYKDSTVATRDSIHRNFTVFNKFSVVHGWVRKPGLKGYFQPKVPEVTVRDENPHTTIKGVRSFRIDEQRKRFSLSAGIGYGFVMSFDDGVAEVRRGPTLSVQFGYDIVRF